MFRTAILIITVALLVMFFNSWLKLRAQKPPSKKPKKIKDEPMVRCDYCGIHVPKSRAVETDDHTFCSRKHRQAHAKSLNDNR